MSNTTTEVLSEQQRAYRACLELPNGDAAQIGLYITQILRTQDLVQWQGNPAQFDQWLKKAICDYVNNCYCVIRARNGGAQ